MNNNGCRGLPAGARGVLAPSSLFPKLWGECIKGDVMQTATETWQHRDIITNGIRMHYVTQGSGPLIVLLHGFPEFWYSWRFQIPFLAAHGYTVVAPDLRGYNDTDKPRKGYDVATLTRDIEGLIKGLGQEDAIIAGHD